MSERDVLVFAETREGMLADIAVDVVGGARALAEARGGEVIAVLLGPAAARHAAALGAADRILVIEDALLDHYEPGAYVDVLAELVRTEAPGLVLLGYTAIALDLAGSLGARLGWPTLFGCKQVQVRSGAVAVTAALYGGKLLADVELTGTAGILVVLPGALRDGRERGAARLEARPSPVPLQPGAIHFLRMIQPEAGDLDITQQQILVSVGRGMKQRENLELAEELADALGGAVSASRPVIDQHWLPPTRQVGKSGMTVKPACYLALGISGAPEHLEGMSDAETIIAVNTDPAAPIFDVAHYGVVGDVLEFVPVLTEAIREARAR